MRRTVLPVAVVLLAGCQLCTQAARAGTLRVVHSIELDSETIFGSGMTWDGQLLWVTGLFQQHKFVDDDIPYPPGPGRFTFARGYYPSDGSVGSNLNHPYGIPGPHGFVWDGDHFWITSTMAVWGLPVDIAPDDIYKFLHDGTEVGVLEAPLSPDAWTSGLAWDGTHLWLSDAKHERIMQVDPADMSVVSSFDSPGPEPRGLTWDGSSLWSVDGSNHLIYQIDPSGNVLDTWTAPVTDPWGITYDGQYLWILDNDSRTIWCAVPEPPTLVLLTIGAAGIVAVARHRRQTTRATFAQINDHLR